MNKQRSFPALVIASLLLLVCLFPAQGWLAHWLPALSGRATFDPSLAILDIPVHLPFTIDLILVPGLFIVLYSIAILIFTSWAHLPLRQALLQRLKSVFSCIVVILLCVAVGGLLSWLLRDHLPDQIRNDLKSLAFNADLHLPNAGQKLLPFRGDILSLLGLFIGITIGIGMIHKAPRTRTRKTIRLTPEQRMTPYQRMLRERQNQNNATPAFPHNGSTPDFHHPISTPARRRYEPSHGLCRCNPLPTFQPEAVNYRPLE